LDEIAAVVRDLSNGKMAWTNVEAKYPKFEQQETKS
jgi:glycyl-tRNA synthetase